MARMDGGRIVKSLHGITKRSASITLLGVFMLTISGQNRADTLLQPFRSFSGNIDFITIGNTLRSRPDSNVVTDSCTVVSNSTANLTVPQGATIKAAYLYWAGSFSTSIGSNQSTPDTLVRLNGQPISADQTYLARITPLGKTTLDFFGARTDVTSLVQAIGVGTYTFSDLSVNTGAPHCFDILVSEPSRTVLAGWSLSIIYELADDLLPVSIANTSDQHIIRIQDGFQALQNSSQTIIESNLNITDPSGARIGFIVFEGDFGDGNNGVGSGGEGFLVNNNALPLTGDFLNTPTDIFNSTINTLFNNRAYGVDADTFDLSSLLLPGQSMIQSDYQTTNDIILLTQQIIRIKATTLGEQLDLSLALSHPSDFFVNEIGQVTANVTNNGSLTESQTISIIIPLASGLGLESFQGTGYNCLENSGFIRCDHEMDLLPGASLPELTLNLMVAPQAAPRVIINAAVTSETLDVNQLNNQSSINVNVIAPDLSTSTKTVLDVNGGLAEPSDILRYTISIIETNGASVNNVSVSDDIPAFVNQLNIISIPPGAQDMSSASGGINATGKINISNISVPALGRVDIVFEVTVGAVLGGRIVNQALILNPLGVGASPQTGEIIIQEDTNLVQGNKPLYLYPPGDIFGGGDFGGEPILEIPQATTTPLELLIDQLELSRLTPPPSIPVPPPGFGFPFPNTFVLIRDPGERQEWILSIPMSRNLRLLGDRLPVHLFIARDDSLNCGIREAVPIEVEISVLDGLASSVIGRQTKVLNLDCANHPTPEADEFTYTQPFTFNVPLMSSDLQLPANSQIIFTVINQFNDIGFRPVVVYPEPRPSLYSRIELLGNSEDLIKIEEISVVDKKSKAALNQFKLGQTLSIQTSISDPFGPHDVSSVELQIFNQNNQLINNQILDQNNRLIQDDIALFSFDYQIPNDFDSSQIRFQLIANEGTENLVIDSQSLSIVGLAELDLTKSTIVLFDPVNLDNFPKAIPGAMIEYTLILTNEGVGIADQDSVTISDAILDNMALVVSDKSNGLSSPVVVKDSNGESNLSFQFENLASRSDDLEFSSDGGQTFNYIPTPDANGVDEKITHIKFNLKGSFLGKAGGVLPRPGVEIKYKTMIQ